MNIRSEKGITNIDITVSIILITIFVTIIGTLAYSINSNTMAMEKRTEAINYAINEIEKLKATNIDELEAMEVSENIGSTGYYKKITVTDYADFEKNQGKGIVRNLVKQVKVEISYKQGKETKTIDLSTLITK